jgi:hypothetical protein
VRFLVASARNSPKVQERGTARPRRRSVIGGVAKRAGLRAVGCGDQIEVETISFRQDSYVCSLYFWNDIDILSYFYACIFS